MIMKLTRARLVAVPCDAPSARACPHADDGRDTKAGGAGLPEIHIIYSVLGLIKHRCSLAFCKRTQNSSSSFLNVYIPDTNRFQTL